MKFILLIKGGGDILVAGREQHFIFRVRSLASVLLPRVERYQSYLLCWCLDSAETLHDLVIINQLLEDRLQDGVWNLLGVYDKIMTEDDTWSSGSALDSENLVQDAVEKTTNMVNSKNWGWHPTMSQHLDT